MLVIRLSRKGRRNHPMYRLLVAEHSKPTDGDFVEIVGHYNPTAPDQPLTVNKERISYWMSKGALPSNSVSKLLNRVGFDLPVEEKHREPKKKPEVIAKEAPAEVPAGGVAPAEAPAEAPALAPAPDESDLSKPTPASSDKPAPASDEASLGKEA